MKWNKINSSEKAIWRAQSRQFVRKKGSYRGHTRSDWRIIFIGRPISPTNFSRYPRYQRLGWFNGREGREFRVPAITPIKIVIAPLLFSAVHFTILCNLRHDSKWLAPVFSNFNNAYSNQLLFLPQIIISTISKTRLIFFETFKM